MASGSEEVSAFPQRAAQVVLIVAASAIVAGGVLFATGSAPKAQPGPGATLAAGTVGAPPPPRPAKTSKPPLPTRGHPSEGLPVSLIGTPVSPPRYHGWTMTVPGSSLRVPPGFGCTDHAAILRDRGGLDHGRTWVELTVRAGRQAVAVAVEEISVRRVARRQADARPRVRCVATKGVDRPTRPHVTLDGANSTKTVAPEVYGGPTIHRLSPGEPLRLTLSVGAARGLYEWELLVTLDLDGRRVIVPVRDGSRPFVLGAGGGGREAAVYCEAPQVSPLSPRRLIRDTPAGSCRDRGSPRPPRPGPGGSLSRR
ncbi:hypothetical protein [Rhizohabitans arisaemae]|uniref:hypothetical protein n=1 Tax=Rhizohabitans arisaemae TaxID=2720610 RepID=UPI0024B15922|nr:hypothetical protein [Rhizohabitans arisaemae]